MKTAPIERLSNELLRLILDQIEPDPDKTVPIDRRQFLSVESFDLPLPSSRGSIRDIRRFRCTCKRFADVGAPLLFARVATRFSNRGLQKLETLAGWPHLASHVRKFSYLVPYFYVNGGKQDDRLQPTRQNGNLRLDVSIFQRKADEQHQILQSEEDVRVLKKAIASFTSLQLVQLLRVTDEEDDRLLSYIRQHEESQNIVNLDWTDACSHGSRTIGTALLSANVPWSRFSSPMLSPASAGFLASHEPHSLSTLAARLTCLTLHFDDGSDLDQKMSELSNLFRTVFTTAEGMQAVHVGFPSHRPLNLPLESVFHHVTWDKLLAFGIQGWNLEAEEIINLVLRYKDRLKGLRLRDVYLKEGSMWRDVLGTLRDSMRRLEWVSLRRIDYVRHFEDIWIAAGAEIPDDPPPGDSDSETDDEEEQPIAGPSSSHAHVNGNTSDDEDSNTTSDSDEEHGPEADEMDFPDLNSPSTPASAPWCTCNGKSFSDTIGELHDNGYSISNKERKAWEEWVVRRCPEHSER